MSARVPQGYFLTPMGKERKPLDRRKRQGKFFFRWLTLSAFGVLLGAFPGPTRAEPDPRGHVPPIGWIRAQFWKHFQLGDFLLEGVLRCGNRTYPFELRTHNRELVYRFRSVPLAFRIRFDRDRTLVQEKGPRDPNWREVAPKDRTKPILDTDVSYEDLSLDFLHWTQVRSLGTDSIKTLSSWAFEAEPGNEPSQYSKVRYWISQEYFALLRADGYGSQDSPIKRLEVNAVERMGDRYIAKEMQISRMSPERGLSTSRTFIEVIGGEQVLRACAPKKS